MPRRGGSVSSAGSSAAAAAAAAAAAGTGEGEGGGSAGARGATSNSAVPASKEAPAPAPAPAPGGGGRHDLSEAANAMAPQIVGPFKNCGTCVLTLVNVTATADMKCPIDLKTVVMRARNAEYNPKRFSACIIRLINKHEPKATALVFKTGKVVVTGSKSNASVDYACKTFARILGKLDNGSGGSAPKINFDLEVDRKVQNMVATTDVGFPIRLEGMVASDQACFCNYEPELFPGLIYRLSDPKICVLIFVSGKVVLTGAKSVEQLEAGFKAVYPLLQKFKKATVLLQTSASASTEPYLGLEPARKKSRA